jgi:hypothetical protein
VIHGASKLWNISSDAKNISCGKLRQKFFETQKKNIFQRRKTGWHVRAFINVKILCYFLWDQHVWNWVTLSPLYVVHESSCEREEKKSEVTKKKIPTRKVSKHTKQILSSELFFFLEEKKNFLSFSSEGEHHWTSSRAKGRFWVNNNNSVSIWKRWVIFWWRILTSEKWKILAKIFHNFLVTMKTQEKTKRKVCCEKILSRSRRKCANCWISSTVPAPNRSIVLWKFPSIFLGFPQYCENLQSIFSLIKRRKKKKI